MRTLTLFRVTVGAAALGFARRALDEALAFATTRKLGNATLADNAVTQANLAEMATGDRRLGLAHLPRRVAAGHASGATTAAPPPWPSSTPPNPRNA